MPTGSGRTLNGQTVFNELAADGVVAEPASDAKHRRAGLRHNPHNLRAATQYHAVLEPAEFGAEDHQFALKSLTGGKDAFSDTEEALTTDILSLGLYPRCFPGTIQTERIRQPQARTSATIRRMAVHGYRHRNGRLREIMQSTKVQTILWCATVDFTHGKKVNPTLWLLEHCRLSLGSSSSCLSRLCAGSQLCWRVSNSASNMTVP